MQNNLIGARITQIRGNLSKAAFARELGVKPAYIGMLESGKNLPSKTLTELICLKFNINKHWFLTGEGPMKKGIYNKEEEKPSQISEGIAILYRPTEERIGNILLKQGAINEKDLQKALEDQRALGRDSELEEILQYFLENPQDKKFCLKMIKGKKEIKEAVEGFASKNLIKEEG